MFILLWSILVSAIIGILWLFLFKKIKILDTPWKYKDLKRTTPVPKLMWIFLILSTIVSIIIFLPWYWHFKTIWSLFIWWVFLAIIAIIDDIKGISSKWRFLIQIVVSLIAIVWAWAIIKDVSFLWWIIHIPYAIWIFLSLVWFILIINALNWFDGINGMGSGLASIWFFTIALLIKFVILPWYVIWIEDKQNLIFLLNLSLIMTWVSFVFTIIEYKPFWLIRDVWIMFLGYVLAFLSLFAWWKVGIIIVVLSLVIFDAFWVIINRLKNKKNPMQWDYTHFHHRLMKHWRKREEIRIFVWVWSIFFMVLMILQWTNTFNKIVIFLMVFVIFFWIHIYLYWIKKLPHGMWERSKDI